MKYFRRHSAQIHGDGLSWVAASGVEDLTSVCITPDLGKAKTPPAPPKGSKDDEDDDEETYGQNSSAKSDATNHVSTAKAVEPKSNGKTAASQPVMGLPPTVYTVRLYFSEPQEVQPGQRVFSVSLQGQVVLNNFDIVAVTGSQNRGVMKEFKKVAVPGPLTVAFTRSPASQFGPLISGVELVAEEDGLSANAIGVK